MKSSISIGFLLSVQKQATCDSKGSEELFTDKGFSDEEKVNMSDIRFRVRGPGWVETVTAAPNWTIQKLLDHLKEKQSAEPAALKYGWPLRTIDLSDLHASIEPLGLKGEAITFVPKESAPEPAVQAAPVASEPAFQPKKVEADSTVIEWPEKDGYLGRSQPALFLGKYSYVSQRYGLCQTITRACLLPLVA